MSKTTANKGAWIVRSNLKQLVARMEVQQGRNITNRLVAEETGIHENTIGRWMDTSNVLNRIDVNVALALCDYCGCKLDDLFVRDYTK